MVLPSVDEPWGLVINEAVYSQIPVVASSDVGAAFDLIEEGVNGFIFKKENVSDLAIKIKAALDIQQARIDEKSLFIKQEWNFYSSVENLQRIIKFFIENKRL